MTDSSSDDDCFESADEDLDEENNIINLRTVPKETGHTDPSTTISSNLSILGGNPEECSHVGKTLQYRKRPERGKSISKPLTAAPPIAKKSTINDKIFNADIVKPDVLIQDITSNLSKNLNKGISTIQHTSSSIKDLVLNSLPVTSTKEETGRFLYDEELISDPSESSSDNNDDSTYGITKVELDKCNELKVNIQYNTSEEKDVHEDNNMETEMSDLEENLKSIAPTDVAQILAKCSEEDASQNTEDLDVTEKENKSHTLEDEFKKMEVVCKEQEIKEGQEVLNNTKDFSMSGNMYKSFVDKDIRFLLPENVNNEDNDEIIPDHSKSESNDYSNVNVTLHDKDGWDTTDFDIYELQTESESKFTNQMEKECPETNIEQNVVVEAEDKGENDNDGWDDFDFDVDFIDQQSTVNTLVTPKLQEKTQHENFSHENTVSETIMNSDSDGFSKWSGWDKFGVKQETKKKTGWTLSGWGVNALLNTASSVTQGISNVLEAGLGAPDPETLAKMEMMANKSDDSENSGSEKLNLDQQREISTINNENNSSLSLFPDFGITNLVAGVTKNIVEHSKVHEIGSKVISGGLDTLESFGKKTMEVLQEGDPGLKKKRALLLGPEKPILSQVLREAKAKAEMENSRMEAKQMAKMCHFETLFDDFQGLIHLEALEMLSRQCELKLEQMKSSLPMKEVEELIGILDEVKELCVIDDNEFKNNFCTMLDFKISLEKAVEPLKKEISTQKIIQVYEELETWLKSEDNYKQSAQCLFQKAISTMAELTAATVQQFHKGGELLSVKEHRKTVEEADCLLQMTGFMCSVINEISEKFLKLHKSHHPENDVIIPRKIKEEARNAASFVKDAFNLLIPVLQLGAAT